MCQNAPFQFWPTTLLGSDLILKDKILSIDIEKSLFPIKRSVKEIDAIKERLEPLNTIEKQEEFDALCEQNPVVLDLLDDVRTALLQGKSEFFYRCPAFAMPL
jgi:hypothetical protein